MITLKPREPKSLGQAIRFGLTKAIVSVALFAGAFFLASNFNANNAFHDFQPAEPALQQDFEDLKADKLQKMKLTHQCWGDTEKPLTENLPGHVLYSVEKNAENILLGGREKTDQALQQIFNNEKHGLIIYAFCV